jgi:endonuclease/exonuclease/phosphatase family metal-dependent hydrolase
VKVLTYNIHGWLTPENASNLEQVAEVIAATGADLVGLNEVFHPYPVSSGTALDWLAERLGMSYAFSATVAADPQPGDLPYGNALLSRWPIQAYAGHHLAPLTSYGQRGLLEVRVLRPDGGPFTAYVIHLDHRSEDIRLPQWAAAVAWLARDRARPHLLLGDFNALAAADFADPQTLARLEAFQAAQGWVAPRFELLAQVQKAGYLDAFARGGSGPGETWTAVAPDRRIDYIFYPAAWAEVRVACQRWDRPPAADASDHLPVLAEFF